MLRPVVSLLAVVVAAALAVCVWPTPYAYEKIAFQVHDGFSSEYVYRVNRLTGQHELMLNSLDNYYAWKNRGTSNANTTGTSSP